MPADHAGSPPAASEEHAPYPPEVIEAAAREVHDEWWRRRLAEGWRRGPVRDDDARTHPCLIPYERLPESEREYDRATVRTALAALRRAGYQIVPAAAPAPAGPAADAAPGTAEVEAALKAGRPLLAFDLAEQGLRRNPDDVRLLQLLALALARSGAPEPAAAMLERLAAEGQADEETLGILARTHKDAALAAPTAGERHARLRAAFELYLRSYRSTGGYYTGINAATVALLIGEAETARALAAEVAILAEEALEAACRVEGERYYPLATIGEAALLAGDDRAAARWLGEAASAAAGRVGDLASKRRKLRLVLDAQGRNLALLDDWLPVPRVGLVQADPHAWSPDDANRIEPPLAAAIEGWMREHRIGFGYASGMPGPDLLFSEILTAEGGRSYLVRPFAAHERDGLGGPASAFWGARAERVAAAADEELAATDAFHPAGTVFRRFAAELRMGLALVHARLLETELHVLDLRATDDAAPDEPPAAALASAGARIHRIDIGLPTRAEDANGPEHAARTPAAGAPFGPVQVAGVLFADVLKYSALDDHQIPLFVDHFLGLIGRIAAASPHRPLARNTWGDGLYFVFRDVRDAGLFALEMQDAVAGTDWGALGLRADLSLRVGLHAGPVLACTDPVTGAPAFTGRHTVRAARIEPVTPPGMIYGSREFAALAIAEDVRDFVCEPVGSVDLAKGAARLPLYVVRRAGATGAPSRPSHT